MNKASLVVDKFYHNNKVFDVNDKIINRDNCMFHMHLMKQKFNENNIDLSTNDINSILESEIVLYFDTPHILPSKESINKSYLIIFESEIIRPDNWEIENHKYFNKIFTWNDDFVDNKKYFKINFPNKIFFNSSEKKEKLCTIIAGNKLVRHPKELYSERIKAILYGMGWDLKTFYGILRPLNRIKCLRKIFNKNYQSYKGKVESKNLTLGKYKFSICYENAKDIPGYITEKIFDCFFAGCVPVYWGAPNITDYVPQNCFIDKRKFETYHELYGYLKNMSENEYSSYIENIKEFLKSEKVKPFSAEYFAERIVNNVLDKIDA